MQALDQAEQGIRGLVIQISCRLIGQQKFRLGNQRARNRDSLLLPTRKFTSAMGRSIRQTHFAEPVCGFLHCLFFGLASGQKGERDVLGSCKFRQKIVELPDIPDLAIAKIRSLTGG